MDKRKLKSHSPSLPMVPNSSPSQASRATISVRFSRHLRAAPPPWRSVDKSPSALDHALSVGFGSVSPPSLPIRPTVAKPRLLQCPSGYGLHWSHLSPRWLSVDPASARPAQPPLGCRQGAQRDPPAALGVCRTHPLRPALWQFPADYASAPSPPAAPAPTPGGVEGSRMAAAGSRRPNV